ncbi:UDP-N-acetylmuramate dehydrogenase [Lujinxingia vulgaris]|uniref:UDP-N-acetylmuramate dehydrogenase n=1 Tax=Lujinxingia vulgaris TaxID=2600176 RepID=UPI0024C09A0B|nr:UDP-N-acetylmuramate dehydrogenase [Lujinxingia vulgaris]
MERFASEARQSSVSADEPLYRRSSLRIGGAARRFVEVGSLEDAMLLLAAVGPDWRRLVWVGLGSNTLFPDEGIDGVVVRMSGELATWQLDASRATVGAGAVNAHLVRGLLREGWVGAEFLSLIPGTFGGAVALNAGTRERELSEVLESCTLARVDEEKGAWHVGTYPASELKLSYRHAGLSDGDVVLSGVLKVERGDVEEAKSRVRQDKERRNRTQPYRLASVGSTFANPQGDFAGRLIEAVGLKGHRVGGAQISELHANFFINAGDATAADFIALMALARHRVREEFGVELRPEVRFVGFDGWAQLIEQEKSLR